MKKLRCVMCDAWFCSLFNNNNKSKEKNMRKAWVKNCAPKRLKRMQEARALSASFSSNMPTLTHSLICYINWKEIKPMSNWGKEMMFKLFFIFPFFFSLFRSAFHIVHVSAHIVYDICINMCACERILYALHFAFVNTSKECINKFANVLP